MRELVTLQVGSFANFVGSHFWNFQVHTQTQALLTHPLTHSTIQLPSLINTIIHIFLKDELNGLAEDPYADPVFKNQSLNMDVLYRSGETHQVCRCFVFICFTLIQMFCFTFFYLETCTHDINRVLWLTLPAWFLLIFKVLENCNWVCVFSGLEMYGSCKLSIFDFCRVPWVYELTWYIVWWGFICIIRYFDMVKRFLKRF